MPSSKASATPDNLFTTCLGTLITRDFQYTELTQTVNETFNFIYLLTLNTGKM